MVTKPKYNINERSTNAWEPYRNQEKCVNNRSSVAHNIINHEENRHAPGLVLGLGDK